MAASDVLPWIGIGWSALTSVVTITYFITKVKDKVDNQGERVTSLTRTADEISEDTRRDIKEVATRISELLITVEGFTREQSVLNTLNGKLADSLTAKIDQLNKITSEHGATLDLMGQLLKIKGMLG
jgi:hypothetical protein